MVQLATAWMLEDRTFTLEATVPANTTATVTLWNARLDQVSEGGLPVLETPGLRARQAGADVVVEIGSGRYRFGVRRET